MACRPLSSSAALIALLGHAKLSQALGDRMGMDEALALRMSQAVVGTSSSSLAPQKMAGLGRRQSQFCTEPGWIKCPTADYCCLPDQICQPNNHLGDGSGWCCPTWALQCNGTACCDPSTASCCGSVCCTHGLACINDQCLAPNGSSTLNPTTTPTAIPTPTTKATSSSASATSAKPSTNGGPSATPSGAQIPQETKPPVAALNLDFARLVFGSRQLSSDLQSQRQQAVSSLFEGICKALGNSTSIVLNFTSDLQAQKVRRKNSECANNPCSSNRSRPACMLFPFASAAATDTKVTATFTCVSPLTQYIQGAILSTFRTRSNISDGDSYKLSLSSFNCQTLSPDLRPSVNHLADVDPAVGSTGTAQSGVARRDLKPGGSDSQTVSFPPFLEQDTLSTLISPIGDMSGGNYTVSTNVNSGSISDLRVVDVEGNKYGSSPDPLSSGNKRSFSFTVPDEAVGVVYLMSTSNNELNVTSSMQNGNTSSNGAFTVHVGVVFGTLLSTATALVALCFM